MPAYDAHVRGAARRLREPRQEAGRRVLRAALLAQLREALIRATARLGSTDLIVNAISASRPPDDGTGFGGGSLATASLAGFEGWAAAVA